MTTANTSTMLSRTAVAKAYRPPVRTYSAVASVYGPLLHENNKEEEEEIHLFITCAIVCPSGIQFVIIILDQNETSKIE